MVLLEHLLGLLEVEVLLAARAPRQLGDGLQVGADHLVLHRLAGDARQAAELAVDLLARLLGQLEGVELLLQLLELAGVVAAAELLLDGLHLLAQEHLALAVAELALDLVLDLLLRVDDVIWRSTCSSTMRRRSSTSAVSSSICLSAAETSR